MTFVVSLNNEYRFFDTECGMNLSGWWNFFLLDEESKGDVILLLREEKYYLIIYVEDKRFGYFITVDFVKVFITANLLKIM